MKEQQSPGWPTYGSPILARALAKVNRVVSCAACDIHTGTARATFLALQSWLKADWDRLNDSNRYEVAMVVPPCFESWPDEFQVKGWRRPSFDERSPEFGNHRLLDVALVMKGSGRECATLLRAGVPLEPNAHIWFVLHVFDKVEQKHYAVIHHGPASTKALWASLTLKSDGTRGRPQRLHLNKADIKRVNRNSRWLYKWVEHQQLFQGTKASTVLFYRFTAACNGEVLGYFPSLTGPDERVEIDHRESKLHGCPWSTTPLREGIHRCLEDARSSASPNGRPAGGGRSAWAANERPLSTQNASPDLGEPFEPELEARLVSETINKIHLALREGRDPTELIGDAVKHQVLGSALLPSEYRELLAGKASTEGQIQHD